MYTVGYINWKGGVGKTTLSTNTAYLFAKWLKPTKGRVLFIDTDKQGNATDWFGGRTDRGTFTDILLEGKDAREIIQPTRYENIDLIASDERLIEANYAVVADKNRIQTGILKKSLQSVQGDYALCIIDNPPDSNLPVLSGLECVDALIAVVAPDAFAIKGLRQLQSELDNYNKLLHLGLGITGVVINRWTSFSFPVHSELRKEYHMFPSIRGGRAAEVWLNMVINEKKSIFEVSPRSGLARDITRFAEQLSKVIEHHYDPSKEVIW